MSSGPLILAAVALASPGVAAAADRDESRTAMAAGVKNLMGGDARSARVLLLNAVKADPDWGLPHAVLARTSLELGDAVSAEASLGRAVAAGIPETSLQHLYLHLWLLTGQTGRVLDTALEPSLPKVSRAYALRIRGRAAAQRGDMDAAAREFDAAVRLAPTSSLLWSDIGRFQLVIGNEAGAVEAATRATALNPRNVEALMLMGTLVRSQFGLVASLPWFEKVLAVDRNNIAAMLELAATQGDAGRARAMLETTRRVLSADPGNAQAYYLQAVVAARIGNHDLARSLLYRTKGRLDDLPGLKLLNAVMAMQENNSEQAIADLQDVLKAQPDNITARRLLGTAMWRAGDARSAISVLGGVARRPDADSYTLSVIGRAYEETGDRALAAQYLGRIAQPYAGAPAPFQPWGDLAQLAAMRSGNPEDANVAVPRIASIIAAGNPAGALAEAQRLQARNVGAPAAHMLVGDAYMAMGRPADAAEAYKRSANIRFTEPVALRFVAALRASNQAAASLRVLDLFLQQNPRSVPGLLLAADHFMISGRWDPALDVLEKLRKRLGNRDATVLNAIGWCWFNKGNSAKARDFGGAAYAIAPSNANVASSYGWFLAQSGSNPKGGIALLRKSVSIAPSLPGYRYRLAHALANAGQTGEARKQLRAALIAGDFNDRKAATALYAQLGGRL
jgi:tetratricopeptide (TPR) repeat protein